MIRVTIEMVPSGIEARKRHMATIEIHNTVTTSVGTKGRRGDYQAKFSRISQRGEHLGWHDRQVTILNVGRNQSGAVYRILHEALGAFLGRST
jgi:hypothetical protein